MSYSSTNKFLIHVIQSEHLCFSFGRYNTKSIKNTDRGFGVAFLILNYTSTNPNDYHKSPIYNVLREIKHHIRPFIQTCILTFFAKIAITDPHLTVERTYIIPWSNVSLPVSYPVYNQSAV